MVVLSEDKACRPSIGRPDCLFHFGFKTTRAAMSDGTTHEKGWPTGIIGTEYALIMPIYTLSVTPFHILLHSCFG